MAVSVTAATGRPARGCGPGTPGCRTAVPPRDGKTPGRHHDRMPAGVWAHVERGSRPGPRATSRREADHVTGRGGGDGSERQAPIPQVIDLTNTQSFRSPSTSTRRSSPLMRKALGGEMRNALHRAATATPVERGGRLVPHQERRFLRERPSDPDHLAPPVRKPGRPLRPPGADQPAIRCPVCGPGNRGISSKAAWPASITANPVLAAGRSRRRDRGRGPARRGCVNRSHRAVIRRDERYPIDLVSSSSAATGHASSPLTVVKGQAVPDRHA